MTTTQPPIYVAQQRPENRRLLRAQAVAYSQAKRAKNRWLAGLAALAFATSVAAAIEDAEAISALSLVGLVLGGVLGITSDVKVNARAQLAVCIQEQFDTGVFQLPWNPLATRQRPSPHEVGRLAGLHRGARMDKPWYSDTATVCRPLDVLICQQANLAWGAPSHRRWAATITAGLAVPVVVIFTLWGRGIISGSQLINLVVMPWGPLAVECWREILAHRASARDKEEAHQRLLEIWHGALAEPVEVSVCRQVQDEIAHVRLRNAHVPDWFDSRHRDENETAMQAATATFIEQAIAAGKG